MAVKEDSATGNNAKVTERNGARKTRSPFNRKKVASAKAAKPKTAKPATGSKKAEGAGVAKCAQAKKAVTKTRTKAQPKFQTKSLAAKTSIAPEERQRLISQAAYLISCRRDPALGNPDTDWIHAEVVIDMIFDVNDPTPKRRSSA